MAAHREQRDIPVYELVVAKGGHKLKEVAEPAPPPPPGPPLDKEGFPSIPGVNYPSYIHEPPIFDQRTMVDGVVTELPIKTVPPEHFYPAYAPTVDADGNEIAGIRTPDIHCPIATYTGWTLYKGIYGTGILIRNAGSAIPFAKTKADRLASGDPRLSLEERYKDHDKYVKCVAQWAQHLAKQRYILPAEVDNYIQRAEDSNILK